MKLTLFQVVLIAVVSSLVTVGALELLRERPRVAVEGAPPLPAPQRASEPEAAVPPAAELAPPRPVPDGTLTALEQRIAALERVDLEERKQRRSRRAVADGTVSDRESLRGMILEMMNEDREERRVLSEEEAIAERSKAMSFEVRYQMQQTDGVDLTDYEVERLVEIILGIEERRAEITENIDPETTRPEDLERDMTELESEMRRQIEQEIGPYRTSLLLGDE